MLTRVLMASLILTSAASATGESAPLRVLTFNLRYITKEDQGIRAWTERRDQVGDVVAKDKPDIIGIQEGLRPMLDDLEQRAPGYTEIGCGRSDGLAKGEYSAILVKTDRFSILGSGTFWLSDTPEIAGSTTWGNRVVRICTWAKLYDRRNQISFHYYNTHLDHETPLARQKGTELILSRMAAAGVDGPVIFAGDFNARPEDPLHALIKGAPHHLTDVWAALHPTATPAESGTSHAYTGRVDGSRIDYIYASKDFGLTDSEILRDHIGESYPSDHFPVRATLTFPAPNVPPAP